MKKRIRLLILIGMCALGVSASTIILPMDVTKKDLNVTISPMDVLLSPMGVLVYPLHGDLDGDGVSNQDEVAFGTNPDDNTSYPVIQSYTTTSFYIAYDSNDRTQYALVMPSVQKIYTHQAGDIQHLTQVDTDFNSFPSYDKGQLCFSALKSSASTTQAPTMANKCYEVKFFYTQKERTDNGTAFTLYYKPADKLYEGLAGDASSFQVVKDADEIHNENSITQEDYSHFRFDTVEATVEIGRVK